jgi:predicted Ser/Thr protein kinase/tetratricopeptide (TPR) repeat protein
VETIGRYRVIRPLGQGGMGAVYLCEDPTLERQVAIKLLHRDPSNVGLRDEARALAALNHKGIVTIHEVGDHEGQDFLVMEYLPGKTLREVLDAKKTPRMTLLEICARVAEAVAAAHRAGILHRDIKPENILVTDDEVKVLDFGIARRLSTREAPARPSMIPERLSTAVEPGRADTVVTAATNTLYGTPAYMAPEVFHGEPSSAASDVYSLGIVVYECIAGRRPHDARTLVELIAQVVDGEPAKLADVHAELIADMLSANPARRPDLLEVSSQLAIGRTLLPAASPPPIRPVPAHRARWPLGVLALALVGAIGAVAVWRWPSPSTPEPPPANAVQTLAISTLAVPENLYGGETVIAERVTAQLTEMLERVDPARLVVFVDSPRRMADRTARLEIVRKSGVLTAQVTLVDHRTTEPTKFEVTADDPPIPAIRLTWLLEATARKLVGQLAPGARFERTGNPGEAQRFYSQAGAHLDGADFSKARGALERALLADDQMFEAWYALTFVLAWQNDDSAVATASHARKLTTAGSVEAEVMTGVIQYVQGDYAKARATLAPLDERSKDKPFRREILYFLGESWWHDGHYTEGFKFFERALALERTFRPLLIHMSEYAIVHRDYARASLYLGISNIDTIDFAAGRYESILGSGNSSWRMAVLEMLERPVPPELLTYSSVDLPTHHLARALRAGDGATARKLFASTITENLDKPKLEPHERQALQSLAEVVLVGRMEPETRRVIELLGRHSATGVSRHPYHRLSLLAAGLLRDRSLLITTGLTHRNQLLATAITAELDGDRAKAVATLRELLREPTIHMDLPEKAALLRNLRALGKTRDVAALCQDIRRPVAYRMTIIPFLRDCPRR